MVCPFPLVPQMFSLATRLLMEYSVMSVQTYRGVLYLQNVITVSRYEHAYKPHFVCERKEGTAVRVSIFLKLINVEERYVPCLAKWLPIQTSVEITVPLYLLP